MEANPDLEFDRENAYGFHLDLPSGEFLRFEPNEPKTITIVQMGGSKILQGGSGLALGPLDLSRSSSILQEMQKAGYRHKSQAAAEGEACNPCEMDRSKYAAAYGPTTGD